VQTVVPVHVLDRQTLAREHLPKVRQGELGHFLDVDEWLRSGRFGNLDPLEEMPRIAPPRQPVGHAIDRFRFRRRLPRLGGVDVQVIEHQPAADSQRPCDIGHHLQMLGWVVEVAEAREEVEDDVECLPAEWHAHVMTRKTQTRSLEPPRLGDAACCQIDTGHLALI